MEEMKQLVDLLNKYAYDYYVLDKPTISDGEYDKLYDKLSKMEKETGVIFVVMDKLAKMLQHK